MLDSCLIEKLESKQPLDQAMEWSYVDCNEKSSTAAIIFGVKHLSSRIWQLRKCDQEQNSLGTFNRHGANNLILTETQEKAVFRFCSPQLEMRIEATPSIIYAAISQLCQHEKLNPPSPVSFHYWLGRNSTLYTIKTKPISCVRMITHTEDDPKRFFILYLNTLTKYGIKPTIYIYNMHGLEVIIVCSTGEILIVPTHIHELYTASLKNPQSLTIIETICANGSTPLPPVVICQGKKIIVSWVQDNLTGVEVLAVSQMGYTIESIALGWLAHFIKHVDALAGSATQWRVLLLDSHITQGQNDFLIKSHENKIVPIAFPSHLTYVPQLLNIGVFHPWKYYDNRAIHHALYPLDIVYTIASFFRHLSSIREQIFQPFTIKNIFKQAGIFPLSF